MARDRRLVGAFAVAVVLLTAVGLGAGQSAQPEWAEEVRSDLEDVVDGYNAARASGEANLGPAERLLRDQRGNVYVTAADGSEAVYSFRMDREGYVVSLTPGARGDPTVRVLAGRETVRAIATADDRQAAFRRAVRNGDVRVQGVGALNALALWVLTAFVTRPVLSVGTGAATVTGVAYLTAKVGADAVGAAVRWIQTGVARLSDSASASASRTASASRRAIVRAASGVRAVAARLSDVGLRGLLDALNARLDQLIALLERVLLLLALVEKLANRIEAALGAARDRLGAGWDWLKQKSRAARDAVAGARSQ